MYEGDIAIYLYVWEAWERGQCKAQPQPLVEPAYLRATLSDPVFVYLS